jgi:ATP-dependent DNA ligase
VPEAFDDGPALWETVSEHELEGVVAKRLHERYIPGERLWVKVKNRVYWRWELEREGAIRNRQRSSGRVAKANRVGATCWASRP